MKRTLLIIVILLAGLGLMSYPYVSSYLSARNASKVVDKYEKTVKEIDPAVRAAELKRAHAYNDALAGDPVHDPFIPGSGIVRDANYASILNIDGTMAYVDIPKINVNLPVYHGTSAAVLEKGIGHLEGTSLPVGGKRTHAVLTGHTGVSYARLFTDLIDLKNGDTFYIHVLGETLAYQVDQIRVVVPSDTSLLSLYPNEDYVTLVTCTPYGINSHRLFVRGHRIPYTPGMEQAAQGPKGLTHEQKLMLMAAGITAAFMLLLILFVVHRRRRKLKKEAVEAGIAATEGAAVSTTVTKDAAAKDTATGVAEAVVVSKAPSSSRHPQS